jgi:hypothetical protein
MIEAHAHLAYAPRGAGLLYAVLWFADGPNVYGWYIGSRDGVPEASYFVLPDHYTAKPDVLYRSLEDDLYGPWVQITERGQSELSESPPVPQALCHELARVQDEFIRHWLFFDSDPDSEAQARALNARELPVRHVNIKASRLGKLHTSPAVWRYDAPGADQNVLVYLSQRWPLDERLYA